MKTLSALQVNFHKHLLNLPSNIQQEVVAGGRISVEHRLHIYHNAYRVRLLETLQDAFEKTWAYLGDDAFESAALAFIEKTPPRHRNLRWYGEGFPQWLATRFPNDGDIAELAIIDWQLRHAFDAPDAPPLRVADLASLSTADWDKVGFCFTPSLCVTPLQYNTVSIWHALDREEAPPTAESLAEASWLLIWRKCWQPHFRTIQDVEFGALSSLIQGESFAQMCGRLNELFPERDSAMLAAEMLATWLRDELIVALTGIIKAYKVP